MNPKKREVVGCSFIREECNAMFDPEQVDVHVHAIMGDNDMLVDGCKPRLAAFRAGCKDGPPAKDLQWSVWLIRKVLQGGDYAAHIDTQFDADDSTPVAEAFAGSTWRLGKDAPEAESRWRANRDFWFLSQRRLLRGWSTKMCVFANHQRSFLA